MRSFLTGTLAGWLLLSAAFAPKPALAGAYGTEPDPGLPMNCQDLTIAYRVIASSNRSSPSIIRAEALYRSAMAGCKSNPRQSIHKLHATLHLVTPS